MIKSQVDDIPTVLYLGCNRPMRLVFWDRPKAGWRPPRSGANNAARKNKLEFASGNKS